MCILACTEADHPLPPTTATAAGGMHPTGMHLCLDEVFGEQGLMSQYFDQWTYTLIKFGVMQVVQKRNLSKSKRNRSVTFH